MFYLQDFLDQLQELPQQIQNDLVEMNNLDVIVRDSMDHVTSSIEKLFLNVDHMNASELETQFQAFMREGDNTVQISDIKIQKASSITNLLNKYIKQLYNDLNRFKEELNSNNDGIAEIIEKRVLDTEKSKNTYAKENKHKPKQYLFKDQQTTSKSIKCKENSELILNNDYEAGNGDLDSSSLEYIKSINGLKQEQIASSSSSCIELSDTVVPAGSNVTSYTTPRNNQNTIKVRNKKKSKSRIKRYCICNEVAYDLMVACDNITCPYKWFHFECVGITQRPIDDWYCNPCIEEMKKLLPYNIFFINFVIKLNPIVL